ncbi:hypothetical protein PoB_004908700, partial [Plakobranchus ocellatus]
MSTRDPDVKFYSSKTLNTFNNSFNIPFVLRDNNSFSCAHNLIPDVSEFTISGGLGSNPDWLTDNDDTTCNDENAQTITVRLATPHPLTWVRIVVSDTANLTEFQLGYQTSTTGVALCDNARSARVDDKTLDIFCPTSTIVTHVTVSGLGVSTLCSLFISG